MENNRYSTPVLFDGVGQYREARDIKVIHRLIQYENTRNVIGDRPAGLTLETEEKCTQKLEYFEESNYVCRGKF